MAPITPKRRRELGEIRRNLDRTANQIVDGDEYLESVKAVTSQDEEITLQIRPLTDLAIMRAIDEAGLTIAEFFPKKGAERKNLTVDPSGIRKIDAIHKILTLALLRDGETLSENTIAGLLPMEERIRLYGEVTRLSGEIYQPKPEVLEKFRSKQSAVRGAGSSGNSDDSVRDGDPAGKPNEEADAAAADVSDSGA